MAAVRHRRRASRAAAFALAWALSLGGAARAPAAAAAGAVGAIETVVPSLGKQLVRVPAGALVVAAPMVTDLPVSSARGEELPARVAQLLAGGLGAPASAHPQTASLAVARAAAATASALVYLHVEVARGELRTTADVYPVMSNGWDRIRVPQPSPRAHAFASAPVDAEVRAFLPPVPLESAEVHRVPHEESNVLAMACGDVDGDGGLELVLVSRARVVLGRIAGGKFVVNRAAPWSALAPLVPVPLRQPLGGARVLPLGEGPSLLVGTSDRGGVALDAALRPLARFRGIPFAGADPGAACALIDPRDNAFTGPASECQVDEKPKVAKDAPRGSADPPRYDAIANLGLVSRGGVARALNVAREPGGRLHLRLGDATRVVDGAGSAVAVGDLDQDGEPEIVTSQNEGDDAVVISSWQAAGSGAGDLRERVRFAAPDGVQALAVCPPEDRDVPALVAVVGSEVWVVR